jgi:hypothetical protein
VALARVQRLECNTKLSKQPTTVAFLSGILDRELLWFDFKSIEKETLNRADLDKLLLLSKTEPKAS